MAEAYEQPFIPDELLSEFDDGAREAHAKLVATSYQELINKMPPSQVVDIGGRHIKYAQLVPESEEDETKAVILHLPFANTWQPHMYLRAKAAQLIAAPDKRLIILPGHSIGNKAYDLTKEEMAKVAQGNLAPIAEQQARLIASIGLGWVAIQGYSGYSGGASNGAALAKIAAQDTKIHSLGMFETPNATARTKKQLSKDFQKTGLAPFLQAVVDAKIPALNKAMGVHSIDNPFKSGPDRVNAPSAKLAFGLANFGLSANLIAENRALRQGMTKDNLSDLVKPILQAQPDTNVLLANAQNSLIQPTGDLTRHYKILHSLFGDQVQMLTVGHYGHEMGDNIVIPALLIKRSLKKTTA